MITIKEGDLFAAAAGAFGLLFQIMERHAAAQAGALDAALITGAGRGGDDFYDRFEQPLVAAGWDVIVFIPSAEEDADRITCGNALISALRNETKG